jgi:hypothetical protein
MNRNARFKILSLLTASVWAAATFTLVQRKKLASKAAVTVALATEPRLVRIQVKGDKTQPAAYIETPTTLSLLPGRRKIRILRDGYRGHDMMVEGDAGDQINMGGVVLERDPDAVFGKLAVKVEGGPVWFEVDDGLFRGEQSAESDDIVVGAEHVLSVSLAREPESSRVRCRFLLTDTHVETPHAVTVRRVKSKGGKPDTLKVIPCEKPGGSVKKRLPRQPGAEPASPEPGPKAELK